MTDTKDDSRVTIKRTKAQPVKGTDLMSFFLKSGTTEAAVRSLLGVSKSKWVAEAGNTQVIEDPTLAMLMRLYNKNPHLFPKEVDIRQFYADIGGRNVINPADFSLLLGREKSAYTRWFSGINRTNKTLNNLIGQALLLANGDAKKAFEIIKDLYSEEANARGVDPIQSEQRKWTTDSEGTRRSASARTKKAKSAARLDSALTSGKKATKKASPATRGKKAPTPRKPRASTK